MALATPAECVTQTASATKKPSTSGASPMSGPPSGVKEKMPLKPSSICGVAQRGQQVLAVLPRGQEVFQGELEAGGHAVVGHFLCGDLRQGGHVHRHGAVGVAADADPVAPFAVVQVLVLVAQDGLAGAVGELVDALEFGQRGGLMTYWWASGSSGTSRPTILPSSRPQKPAQDTTMSAGITPSAVSTPVTLPPSWAMPVTVVEPTEGHAALAGTLDQQLHRTGGQGQAVGGDEQAAQDFAAAREFAGVQEGVDLLAFVSVDDPAFDAPGGGMTPILRLRSASAPRGWWPAPGRPPG